LFDRKDTSQQLEILLPVFLLERRINLIKSKMEELENVVPEIKLSKKLGKKAG